MDDSDEHNYSEYYPNVQKLNIIISDWAREGIAFCGLIHNHPNGQFKLSEVDKEYFSKIYHSADNVNYICCPVIVYNNNEVSIHMYIYNGNWEKATLEILEKN